MKRKFEEAESPNSKKRNPQCWLMKAESESRIVKGKDVKFSIDDLAEMSEQTSPWDGVRNYEARNMMKRMNVGDMVLFYHSNCKVPGVAGVAKVVKEAYPDHTATDPNHPYYDRKPLKDGEARWVMVDVQLVEKFPRIVSLKEMQENAELAEMPLFKRSRLSIQPVPQDCFNIVCNMAKE